MIVSSRVNQRIESFAKIENSLLCWREKVASSKNPGSSFFSFFFALMEVAEMSAVFSELSH